MIAEVWKAVFGETIPGPSHRRVAPDTYRTRCPFHHDQDPSCDVHLTKNVFFCRAGCGGGGYLDVVVRAGLASDRREAAAWLERRGVSLA